MSGAVFFDLDDTLFDHRLASSRALAEVRGAEPVLSGEPLEAIEREYFEMLENLHAAVLNGEISPGDARAERFRRLFAAFGEDIGPDHARRVAARYQRAYAGNRRPVAGAAELLRALRPSASIVVVTNNFTREQEGKLRDCGLDGLVDHLVTSEEVGEPKPARKIFEAALGRAGCRAEEAVMVGDSWRADVAGAASAGIRAVWYNPRREPRPDHPPAAELRSFEPVETALGVILCGAR